MPTFKQTFITAHDRAVESIARLFKIVPVNVDLMNYKPHEKSMVMHDLVKHLQQTELYFVRGALTNVWDMESVKWYVGKHEPMIDQLMADRREAMGMLDEIPNDDLLQRQVGLSYMTGTLADILFHNLDHIGHHRTQLFYYLKLLEEPVDSRSIWGPS